MGYNYMKQTGALLGPCNAFMAQAHFNQPHELSFAGSTMKFETMPRKNHVCKGRLNWLKPEGNWLPHALSVEHWLTRSVLFISDLEWKKSRQKWLAVSNPLEHRQHALEIIWSSHVAVKCHTHRDHMSTCTVLGQTEILIYRSRAICGNKAFVEKHFSGKRRWLSC